MRMPADSRYEDTLSQRDPAIVGRFRRAGDWHVFFGAHPNS